MSSKTQIDGRKSSLPVAAGYFIVLTSWQLYKFLGSHYSLQWFPVLYVIVDSLYAIYDNTIIGSSQKGIRKKPYICNLCVLLLYFEWNVMFLFRYKWYIFAMELIGAIIVRWCRSNLLSCQTDIGAKLTPWGSTIWASTH